VTAPYAIARKSAFPKLLFLGVNFNPRAISRRIGNIKAATAWAEIINGNSAEVKRTPTSRVEGLLSNRLMNSSASLFDSPEDIIAAAITNAPRMKKTALLPRREKASEEGRTPKIGKRAKTKKPVTGRGRNCVIHMVMLKQNTARQFCPGLDKPAMVGRATRIMETATPQKRKDLFTSLCIRL